MTTWISFFLFSFLQPTDISKISYAAQSKIWVQHPYSSLSLPLYSFNAPKPLPHFAPHSPLPFTSTPFFPLCLSSLAYNYDPLPLLHISLMTGAEFFSLSAYCFLSSHISSILALIMLDNQRPHIHNLLHHLSILSLFHFVPLWEDDQLC